MKPEYFIDTSVWIPYFRDGGAEYGDFIDALIDENRVHINGIVLAELLTEARSPAEIDRLSLALAGLKFVPSDRDSFQSAGRNGYALKRKGVSVPLSDVIISSDCIDHGLVLVESDKHYAAIAVHLPLKRHGQLLHIPG
jgi:predicted nucleic acid-binding protein